MTDLPASHDDTWDGDELYDKVETISRRHDNRDVEEWLLALYGLVSQTQGTPMTADLFLEILDASFTAPAVPFDPAWREIINPPDDKWKRKFTDTPSASTPTDRSDDQAGYRFTLNVLRFQTAEVHRMRGKQLDDHQRYFGLSSETGNRWDNFDPKGILECGARGLSDAGPGSAYDWSLLGELLEIGRVYE